jgi:hypothetical protein
LDTALGRSVIDFVLGPLHRSDRLGAPAPQRGGGCGRMNAIAVFPSATSLSA